MRATAAALVLSLTVLSLTVLIMSDSLFNFDWCSITVVFGDLLQSTSSLLESVLSDTRIDIWYGMHQNVVTLWTGRISRVS